MRPPVASPSPACYEISMDRFADFRPRVDYVKWVLRLFAWDGLLPVALVLVPWAIKFVLPNQRGPIEAAAVILPIVAFFVRLLGGLAHIAANHCSRGFRVVQRIVFCAGIFALVLIDAVLILAHIIPAAAFSPEDALIIGGVIGAYLVAMAIAMYPGAEPVATSVC